MCVGCWGELGVKAGPRALLRIEVAGFQSCGTAENGPLAGSSDLESRHWALASRTAGAGLLTHQEEWRRAGTTATIEEAKKLATLACN